MVSSNQTQQVEKVLAVLGDLARSQNPQMRKGGLIGLAAAAIALGKVKFSVSFLIIDPESSKLILDLVVGLQSAADRTSAAMFYRR